MLTLIWSFRNRIDVLKQSIETAHNCCPSSVDFCLVDAASNDECIRELRTFVNNIPNRNIRVCESAYRTTLPQAWNLGIMLSNTRYVAFASSDVLFSNKNWYTQLTDSFTKNYEYILIENHAVFGLDKNCISRLGWFDERYKNGPHFDTDYMIRASENNIKFGVLPNNSYSHGDSDEVSIERSSCEVENRLPMNTLDNEKHFKAKWSSNWPGWEDHLNEVHKPHPPTHISQVSRLLPEINPYPLYENINFRS